ncbi:hypothetical protein B296_00042342 [Ensete ventricosum]|uniref:Uncharacterized protein n=1 Tax=Ensete ventricosum TaxID=4639 RepID=A0A426X7R6_ENSVE|nr:hypothetical protein B296_00042342 [Ensete ventricosum]
MIVKRSYRSDMDPRSSLGSSQGLDDTVGAHREFARTSPKVSGRLLGHAGGSPEKDCETYRRECRRLSDCGMSGGCTTVAQDFKWLSATKPLLPWILGTFGD